MTFPINLILPYSTNTWKIWKEFHLFMYRCMGLVACVTLQAKDNRKNWCIFLNFFSFFVIDGVMQRYFIMSNFF